MKTGLWAATFLFGLLVVFAAMAAEEMPQPELGTPMAPTPDAPRVDEFRLLHADSMTLTRQEDKPHVLEGAVDIIMVDKAGNETEIEAEKITIYYEKDLKKIKRIEAEKRVKITRLGTVATTELAVYRGGENIVELLIDPQVKDSRGQLSANRITIHLNSDEVVAEGDVKGVVLPVAIEEVSSK